MGDPETPTSSKASAEAPLRILGLVEGNDRTAMSGVPGYVFDGLERVGNRVERVDYSPAGMAKLGLAAATFRPRRRAWVARFHTSQTAHRALSRTMARRVRSRRGEFDVALQVHSWAAGQPDPYTLYVDQTRLMAERGWPEWMPFTRRERSALLAREAEMYERAAHIFTMGGPARESLINDYEVDDQGISVVGGGLNLAALPPPRRLPLEPTILFVGRELARKGGDWLLESFKQVRSEIPAATLQMVGVREPIDAPGVINHGFVGDRAQIESLYESARVFCMPTRYEPWGLVFAEAMAHGIPCVGSDVQSIPEILGHGSVGRIVPVDDVEALATALVELLTDDELAREMGERGRRLVEETQTWEHVGRRMQPGLARAASLG